ncbi:MULTISPECIES: GMC family oxidoreductase [unclassified Pseudonocardia]|uniref:GMC family oxidoreductase n=1 Tax=unclassified Pseudonocardia TaxID=2619320 RepID=UPI000962DD8A|nr:GMC family oxidoreductase [Pseudonocardia sp. Ae707_Ps1]OLM18316.1 putative oxidoreductase [Pseudonocardia sp. Ae707_Ps1]
MPANLSTGNLGAALAAHPPCVVTRLIEDIDRVAIYTTQVRLEGTACVRTLPGGRHVVRHALTDRDRATLHDAMRRTVTLLLQAGATELYPCIPGAGPWTGPDQAYAELDISDTRTWGMVSVHAMASCRMGRPERGGVCDDDGRPHGVDGLVICDASVLPGSTGISPQQTVMAFAHEITERFLNRAGVRGTPFRVRPC